MSEQGTEGPRFYSVGDAARLLGLAEMTIYRAISAGEFPAVRIRGRLIVPAAAIDAMAAAAVGGNRLINAAEWVRPAESITEVTR